MKKSKISNNSFGSLVRKTRLDLGIGQRELAKKIGIAASYLNDIEKEKRTAPKLNIIKKLFQHSLFKISKMFKNTSYTKKFLIFICLIARDTKKVYHLNIL